MPKRSKKVVEPVVEEDIEVSSDEEWEPEAADEAYVDDEEDRAAKANAASAAQRKNTRRKARQAGYRKLALQVGAGAGKRSAHKDIVKYALTESDLRRLAQWAPETGDGVSDERSLRDRLVLKYASLPSGTAAVLHANVETFARNIMADVVDRVRDGASNTVTAAHMRSALRKFQGAFAFDFEMPYGVISHARTTEKGHFSGTGEEREWVPNGMLLPEFDDKAKVKDDEMRANAKLMGKIIKSKERAFQLKQDENRKRRAKLVEQRRTGEQNEQNGDSGQPVEATI